MFKPTVRTVLCTIALASAASVTTAATIGLMAPLSGPQALVGQDQVDGFMLALEQRGGKLAGKAGRALN
jgi:branched-chain amino acid transport system substrate-binding protein